MSKIPIIDPSRPGPAPGGARTPSSFGPAESASSFNDHLRRAGRPADRSPRVETHSAAAARGDEPTSRRETEVDEGRSTERPLAGDPQSDAENTESSARDSSAIEEAPAEADTDRPRSATDEATRQGDVLQLSDDAELAESQSSTDDAAPGEIGTTDEARSAIAVARRRARGASAESSSVSGATEEAAGGEVDISDERATNAAEGRSRSTAVRRRTTGSEVVATAEGIETEEREEAGRPLSSTTKADLPGDVRVEDRLALPKLPAGGSTNAVAPGDLVEDDRPAAIVVLSQSGHGSGGPVDSETQTLASEKTLVAAEQSSGAATAGERSPGQSPSRQTTSRQPTSPARHTPAAAAAETIQIQDAEPVSGADPSNLDRDRPSEANSTPSKLALESTGEFDRTTPRRDTITVGSRLAMSRPGASERDSVDRARFVSRVAGAFQAAGRDGGEVRLRLHPPELGVVRLEVKMDAGVLTARFETETSSARTALLDNMALLRERLAEQGIKIDKFNVDLMDRRPEDSPYGPSGGNDREDDRQAPDRETPLESFDRRDGPAEEPPSSTLDVVDSTGQLNVVI